MSKLLIYSGIYIFGVLISSLSQILLKKSADIERESKIKEYLNFKTIFAYCMFFSATICTMLAYKYIPLSMGPILESMGYIFIAVFSYYLLKEKITKRKLAGLIIIIIGIIIFSIK